MLKQADTISGFLNRAYITRYAANNTFRMKFSFSRIFSLRMYTKKESKEESLMLVYFLFVKVALMIPSRWSLHQERFFFRGESSERIVALHGWATKKVMTMFRAFFSNELTRSLSIKYEGEEDIAIYAHKQTRYPGFKNCRAYAKKESAGPLMNFDYNEFKLWVMDISKT